MDPKLLSGEVEDADFVDITGESEDITDMQNDIDSQMDRLFEEFGGDANDAEFKIHVKRAIVGKGEMEVCFCCTPAELPITDRIQHQYGPGTYEIWVYKNGKRFRKRTLHIAKPLQGYSTAPQHVAQPNPSTDMAGLINSMGENNRQVMEQMQAMVNNQPQPQPLNVMGIITGAATLLPIIKEILAPPNQTSELNTFMKAMEFAKDMNGSDKETNLFDLAKSLGGPLMEMTSKLADQQKPVISTQPQTNQPVATVQNNPIPQTQPETGPQFKQQLAMLVAMAHQQKDPALYADMILDNVSPEHIGVFIDRPDTVDYLVSIDPNVAHFRPWFDKLKEELKSALTEPGEGDHTVENEQTNLANGALDHEQVSDAVSESKASNAEDSNAPGNT